MNGFLLEDCSGLKEKPIDVNILESYKPSMSCFHAHSHYEISFILSGNVTVLLSEQINSGTQPRVVLLRPFTKHYMIPEPDRLYRRINVSFTEKFVTAMPGDWASLYSIFSKNGEILLPDESQCRLLEQLLIILDAETDPARCRFLLMYYLSFLSEMNGMQKSERINTPENVLKALLYINEHFHEKITAETLAEHLHIGRTTLMLGFRRSTGITFHQYLQNVRVRNVSLMHERGMSVAAAAEACGFCDAGGYIRAYRKIYGTTPTGRK